MKSKHRLITACLVTAFAFLAPAFANHHEATAKAEKAPKGELIRVTEKDKEWAAKARASYTLDVCPVSNEKLGSMGGAPEYIYRVEGKPDRLVIFCCSGCDEDFLKDPEKYLSKTSAGAKDVPKAAAPAKTSATTAVCSCCG